MNKSYFYVPCDGGGVVNNDYRFYFRLYVQKDGDIPRLLEQGQEELIPSWEQKYKATLNTNNPYPEYD